MVSSCYMGLEIMQCLVHSLIVDLFIYFDEAVLFVTLLNCFPRMSDVVFTYRVCLMHHFHCIQHPSCPFL